MSSDKGLTSVLVAVFLASTTTYLTQSGTGVTPFTSHAGVSQTQGSVGRASPGAATSATDAGESRRTHRDALWLIQAHLGQLPTPDPGWDSEEAFVAVHPASAIEADRRARVERVRRAATGTEVEFLIATVPDPIDSNARWQFDPIYDSLQRAIGAGGFVLDSFFIPDWDAGRNPDTDRQATGRLHERVPGVVLFRRGSGSGLLVVFLVFETATGGVHQTAFQRAVWTIWRWYGADAHIRVIGPTFSGSIGSLGRAIVQSQAELDAVLGYRIVSGAATNEGNADILGAIVGERAIVSYRTTVLTDGELLRVLAAFLRERIGPSRLAILVEGNTAYGGALRGLLQQTGDAALCAGSCAVLPFPLHISRLRNAAENAGLLRPGSAGGALQSLPLLLDEPTAPMDQVPSMAPRLTSSSTELALAAILETIEREHIRAVGLFATDTRDKLFLAQQISLRSPDVLLFTIEGDQLLAHPDFRRYTHGMIVASSYPVFMGTQLWAPTATGREARHQFVSTNAEGVYNAALSILSYDANGWARPPRPTGSPVAATRAPTLLDYRATGTRDGRPGPFAWISVVGRDGIWPLHRDDVGCGAASQSGTAPDPRECGGYLQPFQALRSAGLPVEGGRVLLPARDQAGSDHRPIHTSPSMMVLFVALQLLVLIHMAWRVQRTWVEAAEKPGVERVGVFGWELSAGLALLLGQLGALTVLSGHNDVLAPYVPSSPEAADARWWGDTAFLVAATITAVLTMVTFALGAIAFFGSGTQRALASNVRAAARMGQSTAGSAVAVALAFLSIVGVLAMTGVPRSAGGLLGDEPLTLLNRGLQPFSGVSPFAPVFIAITAMYLFSAAQLANAARPSLTRRTRRGALAELAVGGFDTLVEPIGDAIRRPVGLRDRSVWVLVAVVLAAAFFAYVEEVQTAETRTFDAFYVSAWLLLQLLIAAALVQHYRLWRATKRLLKALSVHPMAEAFRGVPRELFANRWPSRGPRAIHLQHPVSAYAALKQALQPLQPQAAAEPPAVHPLHPTLDALDAAGTLQHFLARELAKRSGQWPLMSWSKTWTHIQRRMEAILPHLMPLWQSGKPTVVVNGSPENRHPWQLKAEVFLAIPMALMIRELMARVVRGLYVAIGAVVLLAAYSIAIPVYPRHALLAVMWLYVFVTVLTTITTLVAAERDAVLSRLAGTSPGRIEWDAAFIKRTILPVLIVLLTLFAIQFPEAGNAILQWLRPVQTALP